MFLPLRPARRLLPILLLLALAAAAALPGCGRSARPRLFVIGLDGATFDLIGPWLDKGELPHLKKLMSEGVYGELESVHPILSPVAWTSAATGVNPGKHGIFDFERPDPTKPGRQLLYTAKERRAVPVWTLLSDAKMKVAVCNVPMTWPPDQVNGLMISGFPFPERTDDIVWTYPAELQKELPDYPLDRMGESLVPGSEGASLANMVHARDAVADVFMDWIKTRKDDFTWVVFTATDRVQHFFWGFMDPKHPFYTPEKHAEFGEAMHDFWKATDARLGGILDALPADATVLVISDHGFGPIYREVNTLNWFQRSPLNDYVRSHPVPDMYITNGIFRYRLGTTHPKGPEYEIFRDMYIRQAEGLVDTVSGQKPVEQAVKREVLFAGRNVQKAPDIVMIEAPHYYIGPGDPTKDLGDVTDLHSTSFSAYHRPNGIFIMKGPGIRTGELKGASLLDVAPTILHVMGQAIPSEVDGRVLTAVFTSEALAKNRPRYTDGTKLLFDRPEQVLSEQERERLKSVPYLDGDK